MNFLQILMFIFIGGVIAAVIYGAIIGRKKDKEEDLTEHFCDVCDDMTAHRIHGSGFNETLHCVKCEEEYS